MGSAGQQPLITFAWHRLNCVPFRRLFLVGLLSCVWSFPAWAEERPVARSLWQTVLTPPTADQMPRKPWVLRDREITLIFPLFKYLRMAEPGPLPELIIGFFVGATKNWVLP